ncbi:DUF4880 domain-containing protein [Caulobacter sp.]|uniref:DUF4880 domain-containing protein n=1 Tax=Caulobacter sp. TaxID=78 RepID=UPI0031E3DDFE
MRRRSGNAGDPAFLAWLAASEEHDRAWARAQAVWRRAAQELEDDPLAEALRASALAARSPVWPKVLAAASIAAVVLRGAAGGWRHWSGREQPQATQVAALPQFVTRVGERRAVTLPDGTRLDLDSDTRVDVALTARRAARS